MTCVCPAPGSFLCCLSSSKVFFWIWLLHSFEMKATISLLSQTIPVFWEVVYKDLSHILMAFCYCHTYNTMITSLQFADPRKDIQRKMNICHTSQVPWLCWPHYSPVNGQDDCTSRSGCLRSIRVKLKATNPSAEKFRQIYYWLKLALLPMWLRSYTRTLHRATALLLRHILRSVHGRISSWKRNFVVWMSIPLHFKSK